MPSPIYLDYCATTPVAERVLDAMLPYFRQSFGNASSHGHAYGWAAAEAVQQARERVAALVGAEPDEIIFTSGATESLNLALKGIFEAYRANGNGFLALATEHKAVLDACHTLEKNGAAVAYLPVQPNGLVSLGDVLPTPGTLAVAVMLANNETGVIQPLRAISDKAKAAGALVVCDATQAVGKIPVDVQALGIDVMAFSAHKMYGPKGVGALYVRRRSPRVRLVAQLDGGGHEKGLRSGTLNVPGIVGLGAAAELAATEMEAQGKRLAALRDRLEAALQAALPIRINGIDAPRLPHVSNITFLSAPADGSSQLAARLTRIAVAAGSACSSALPAPSHVLQAMGLSPADAYRTVRISLGAPTTESEIDAVVAYIGGCLQG